MSFLIPVWNIVLAYISYFLCRIVYIWQNWGIIGAGCEDLDLWRAICGSLVFDTSAICYTMVLYVLLMLLPLPVRNKNWYQTICKVYFLAVSGICTVMNLGDSLYFPYAERRTTIATLFEFKNESLSNILKICFIETERNWYLLIIAILLIVAMSLLYKKGCDTEKQSTLQGKIAIRCTGAVLCVAVIALMFAGMRGGFSRRTRPINIAYAMRYVNTPAQAAAILNTPFSMITSDPDAGYKRESYLSDDELKHYYSPVHPASTGRWPGLDKPNIVIIIVESLSQEFIGSYNKYACGTPFLDSLRSVSISPREAFSNGNKSIDALPSILSSVPRLEEHLVLTPYANNRFSSVVSELSRQGYSSAFFHGSTAGSMGFDAFASSVGVKKFYSYTDYCKDSRFNGDKDFDGQWAVWDEEFLQYFALHTSDLKEPFIATIFTASSHHPFVVPEKYKDVFNGPGHPMYNCIRYIDHSLRRYFSTASEQPWYDNTIFVLTADHTSSVSDHEEYLNDELGWYRIPIMIFDPSGTLPRGIVDKTAQQIDIFPTIMGIAGDNSEYIAFGKDFLDDKSGDWAYIYKEIHTLHKSGKDIVFDGERIASGSEKEIEAGDLLLLKAFIQDYKSRMIDNNLTIKYSDTLQ